MTRRALLPTVAFALAGSLAAASPRRQRRSTSPAGEPRPNILVIMADDVGLLERRRLQPRHDGADAEHRPHRPRGHALHRPLRPADLHAGPRRLHHRAAADPHRPDTVGMPGSPVGLDQRDPTLAEVLKPLGYRTGAVRQEPPRRPQRAPADRPRLRRVLRQPLPPQHRGGARAAGVAEGPGLQPALPPARRARLRGHATSTTRPSTRASAGSGKQRSRTPGR